MNGPPTSSPTVSALPSQRPPAGKRELPPRVAVVDTGPLFAAVDRDDPDHRQSLAALGSPGLRLVIPMLVAAEASYLVGARLGPQAETLFLASLSDSDVRAPEPEDWVRISELVRKYRDLPLGGADASVVVLADRLRTRLVITLDRRHFQVVRNAAGQPLELLPNS